MLLQHNSATSTLETHMSTLKEIELQIESSNYKKDVHNKFQKLFPEAVYPPVSYGWPHRSNVVRALD
jgi:hypothetical protein